MPSLEGDVAVLHHFETPVVKEPGDELPLILGLRSISEKQGVLETGDTKRLSFPGPGGYTIQWSPGTSHFPLVPAPSGHLMMVVDAYDKIRPAAGLATPTCTFYVTDATSSAEVRTIGAEACEGNDVTALPTLGGRSSRPGGASTGSDASQGGRRADDVGRSHAGGSGE